MSSEPVLAWHFLPAMGKLHYKDSRSVVVGETLTHEGPMKICESGLHASEDILDALSFRRGSVLCRVEVSGDIQRQDDKLCGRNRKCLSMRDITAELREFALLCAEKVLPIFEKKYPNDTRVRDCILVTRKFLKGEASKEELVAARKAAAYAAAAADAADDADAAAYAADDADDAAYAAADDAADDAADAADDAADAADDAARSKARKEMRDWQRETLLSLIK
jgi:hypothetical protein